MEAFNFRLRPAYKEQGRLFTSMSQVYLVFSMSLAYHIVLQHGEVALFTRLGGAGQVDEAPVQADPKVVQRALKEGLVLVHILGTSSNHTDSLYSRVKGLDERVADKEATVRGCLACRSWLGARSPKA
ncbi:hypothetical protein LIA77_05920 [Sarocladium implicatum]|nr:hypothetical protein LIA77_05920 [Sarocladium implicatum]